MKLTLVKLIVIFIAGILAGFFFEFPFYLSLSTSFLSFVLLFYAWYRAGKLWEQDIFFGSISFLVFLLLGINTVQVNLPENQPRHYLNFNSEEEKNLVSLRITETLKPDLYNQKFIAEVEAINQQPTHGKIILYQPHDSLVSPLQVDDEILVFNDFQELKSAFNPFQFDYRNYLNNKKVYKEVRVYENEILAQQKEQTSAVGMASKARNNIISELKNYNFENNELAIIQALLLGEKKDVSKEVYEDYADAGVIHILAVSGLHVGIILWILNFVFKPLKRLKNGKTIHLIIVVSSLWIYAFIAGLSPSIIRAVTMFSFVAIGMQMNRKSDVINSVCASLLILLLVNPFYIFDVGFQLSYSAVISIILFQPLIYGFFNLKNKILNFYWSIFTVTIAAQIGVLPLSLYYFHQFPGLFFISNLIIIPVLGFVLGLGILVIILAMINLLPQFLADFFGNIIHYLNEIVSWVAMQEGYVFKDIPFSTLQAIMAYLVVLTFFLLLKKFKFQNLKYFLVSIIVFQLISIFEIQKSSQQELIVFHKSRKTAVGIKKNKQLLVLSNLEAPKEENFIKNYSLGARIDTIQQKTIPNFLILKNKNLLVIDSLGIFEIKNAALDYILLRNSPKINLQRVLETHPEATFIVDGSNYPYLIKQWKETLLNAKAPFHITGENGAFIVNE